MMRQGRSFFAKPNDLLFTHIHEDHYDQALVDEFQQRYPGRIVYAPMYQKILFSFPDAVRQSTAHSSHSTGINLHLPNDKSEAPCSSPLLELLQYKK